MAAVRWPTYSWEASRSASCAWLAARSWSSGIPSMSSSCRIRWRLRQASTMRKAALALPVGDYLDHPRVVLRDGTVASIRAASDHDREALRQFFHDLSPESRRRRFFRRPNRHPRSSSAWPTPTIRRGLTLIVDRYVDDGTAGPSERNVRPIATASYLAVNPAWLKSRSPSTTGSAALRLGLDAPRAAGRDCVAARLRALSGIDATDTPMPEVFGDSGFEIRSKSSGGAVELRLSLAPSADGVRVAEERDRAATAASLRPLLTPGAVAVVGVSRDPSSIGRRVLVALRAAGFRGPIHPVNAAAELDGLRCCSSARDLPAGTDLAIIAVPSPRVLEVVDDAPPRASSRCSSSRPGSLVGQAGRALQQQLVERVRNHGMRMIGPNCMG